MYFYLFACKVLAALIFGIFSSLPLGLLLRRGYIFYWLLFIALYIGLYYIRQMNAEDFEPYMFWISIKVSRIWLFISASGLLFYLGYNLRKRFLPVSGPAENTAVETA